MQTVEQVEHFLLLLQEAKEKNGPLVKTNLLLFGGELEEFVGQGLTYQPVEGGICFFCKRGGDIFQMYYRLNKTQEQLELPQQRMVLEFFERDEAKIQQTVEFWQKNGFSLLAENFEMERHGTGDPAPAFSSAIDMEEAVPEDSEYILSLWRNNLNTDIHPLPSREALLEDIHNHRIVVCKDENRIPFAAACRTVRNTVCFLERVVVAGPLQSRGYGSQIIEYCLTLPEVKKIRLFVNSQNKRAIKFYENLIFVQTGKRSIQLKNF